MPGGSKYPGDPEKLEQYIAVVDQSESGTEVKGAKNPYTSRNGHMTSFLADDAMAIHLSKEQTEEFRSQYDSGDVMQYGATMRGYSSVPDDLLEDAAAMAAWFDKSWEWIGTLPPKPTRK